MDVQLSQIFCHAYIEIHTKLLWFSCKTVDICDLGCLLPLNKMSQSLFSIRWTALGASAQWLYSAVSHILIAAHLRRVLLAAP